MRPGGDARRRVFLEALAKRAALAPIKRQHRRIGGDAGERASIVARETPAACASRASVARNVLKSPPHGAARADTVKTSAAAHAANKRTIMARR